MTTTTQQLILDRITARVEADDGVMLVHDREWANIGTLRTLDANTLTQIAAVTYDFQSGYCHFGPGPNRVAAHWYGQSAEGKSSWVYGSIPELVAVVTTHLTAKEPNAAPTDT